MAKIKWRDAKKGEVPKVGLLFHWKGYDHTKGKRNEDLYGPFICFRVEGNEGFFRGLNPAVEDGLSTYQPRGYQLGSNLSIHNGSLVWADSLGVKPTIIQPAHRQAGHSRELPHDQSRN